MQNKRIIYPNSQGGISVIHPCECGLSIEQIARKDVPAGVAFLIIEGSDLPTDRTFRDAWEADFSNPDGYGGDYGVGSSWHVIGYDSEGEAIVRRDENSDVEKVGVSK